MNPVPSEDIQFGFHSASDVRADTGTPNSSLRPLHGYLGRAYGARPLQGTAEFENLIERRYR